MFAPFFPPAVCVCVVVVRRISWAKRSLFSFFSVFLPLAAAKRPFLAAAGVCDRARAALLTTSACPWRCDGARTCPVRRRRRTQRRRRRRPRRLPRNDCSLLAPRRRWPPRSSCSPAPLLLRPRGRRRRPAGAPSCRAARPSTGSWAPRRTPPRRRRAGGGGAGGGPSSRRRPSRPKRCSNRLRKKLTNGSV